ncbi:hypothetical protein NC661_04035 [Aquibacillus koreensis]|uniref:Uncharacterized protein n=1 Tax=Aquibacillus koreensis TaxID=279446 RepID=A0A9X4AH21_9BACI|nr:hypothetical protein [Aquibacillus koreensis]MCT2534858.1 hypothetical protein [Aquibacillus koreensis]MDC3419531.1 hypothetical protein [Aquibacillus koreensis]
MESKKRSNRNIIQGIAYAIVVITLTMRIVLFVSGIAQNLAYSTLDAITWTGLAIGIILLLMSYLFPKQP